MKNVDKKVVNAGAWALIGVLAVSIILFVTFVFLSRILGPEVIGLIALADIVIEVGTIFIFFGVKEAIVRAGSVSDADFDTAFWGVLLASVILSISIVLVSDIVVDIFDVAMLKDVLLGLAILPVLFSLGEIHEAKLIRDFGFKKLAKRTVAANLIGGIIAIILATMGFGVWSLIAYRLIIAIINTVYCWVLTQWVPGFHFSTKVYFNLISVGMHLMVGNLISQKSRGVYELSAGYFLGLVSVGYIRLSWRLLDFVSNVFSAPLEKVALPALSELRGNYVKRRAMFLEMLELWGVLFVPSMVGLYALSEHLVGAIFGPEWQQSAAVLKVISVFGIIGILERFTWSAVGSTNSLKFVSIANGSLLVIAIVLAISLAPNGVVAVAWSYAIRNILAIPVLAYAIKHALNVPFSDVLKALSHSILASIVMLATLKLVLIFFLQSPNILEICFLMVLALSSYSCTLYLSNPNRFSILYIAFKRLFIADKATKYTGETKSGATSGKRILLPNLYCVGAQKAGTSSLAEMLSSHPDIYIPPIKEIHYFDQPGNFEKGMEWYLSHFNAARGEKIIADFTPDYLPFDSIPERIRATSNDNIKILISIRNPVSRAYSQFNFYRSKGQEDRNDFASVLAADLGRENVSALETPFSPEYYIARGLYYNQIKRYIDTFGRKNVKVIVFEDLIDASKRQRIISDIIDFLELSSAALPKLPKTNRTVFLKNNNAFSKILINNPEIKLRIKTLLPSMYDDIKNKMHDKLYQYPEKLDSELRDVLYAQYFLEDVLRLEKLLGIELNGWS